MARVGVDMFQDLEEGYDVVSISGRAGCWGWCGLRLIDEILQRAVLVLEKAGAEVRVDLGVCSGVRLCDLNERWRGVDCCDGGCCCD